MKAKQDSKSAWRGTRRIVALVVLPLVALMMVLTLFSLVLRYGGPRMRDKIRLLNKRLLNPPHDEPCRAEALVRRRDPAQGTPLRTGVHDSGGSGAGCRGRLRYSASVR